MTITDLPLLHGVISALVTPCTSTGDPDVSALQALVDRTIDEGAHGLVVGAGTGEVATFSDAERKAIAEHVVKHVDGRVPVAVGTGAVSTQLAVDHSKHAEAIGASAIMVIPPYYEPTGLDETFEYYRSIDAAINVPIVAYNHPHVTGVPLPAAYLARLGRELENVEYVKDSSGDANEVARLAVDYADDIKLLIGFELLILPALQLGAVGCLSGCANFAAGALVRVYEAHARGDTAGAIEAWQRVVPALLAVFDAGPWFASVKAACEITGLPVGDPRAPSLPLGDAARERLAETLGATLAGEFSAQA